MDRKAFYKKHLKTDLSSGLVVFLIALPLCLGISLASGAPLFAGIISGIVGGIVVGFLSGSQVNVSGPAASTALVMLTAITTLGSYQVALVSVVVAGIFQIALGYMRAGTVAYYFPSAMIKGILASIGLILILKQIPHAVGYDRVFEGSESFSQPDSRNTFSELYYLVDSINVGAVIIFIISLVIILAWDRPSVKEKYPFFKFFPAALATVIAGVLINELFMVYYPELALSGERLVTLPEASSFGEFLGFFTFPDFSQIGNLQVYSFALSLTFIASLESLLSTEAGDKLDPYKRRTSTNRELKAQGIGNIVAGMIGGLPVTAVIVRTSANVAANGRSKISTITHGVIMLICVMTIPFMLNKIPLAALSAVLIVVGYRLTSITLYKEMYKQRKRKFLPFILTILAVMFTDLITGILIGGAVAIFFILRDNYKTPFFFNKDAHKDGDNVKIELSEEVTFLNKANVLLTLEHLPDNITVTIDASRSQNIDEDVLEIILEFRKAAELKNIKLNLIDFERHFARTRLTV